jgi:hypothetical protein
MVRENEKHTGKLIMTIACNEGGEDEGDQQG